MPIELKEDEQIVPGAVMNPAEEVSFFADQVPAGFRTDNVVYNSVRAMRQDYFEPQAGYNVLDDLTEDERLNASDFIGVESPGELKQKRQRIAEEQEALDILGADGPWMAFLAAAPGTLVDVTSLLPVIGATGKGVSLGGRALRVGAGASADAAIAEGALQALQETRTLEESLTNIMFSGAFGVGLVGPAAVRSLTTPKITGESLRQAADDMAVAVRDHRGGSLSADAKPIETKKDLEVALEPLAKGLNKFLKATLLEVPSLRLSTSRFTESRRLLREMVDTGIITKGELAGRSMTGPALETRLKVYEAMTVNADQILKRANMKSTGMSKVQFHRAVGRALRNNDRGVNAEVTRTAKSIRQIMERLKDEAIDQNLLPKDVKPQFANSYFTRVYNRDKIVRHMDEFKQKLVSKMREIIEENPEGADTLVKGEAPLTLEELPDLAQGVINKILHGDPAQVDLAGVVPNARGALKERTLFLTDDELTSIGRGEGVLEDDVMAVLPRFFRQVGADVEFQRVFGGKKGFQERLDKLADEKDALVAAAKNERQIKRILKDFEKDTAMLSKIQQKLQGTDALGKRLDDLINEDARTAFKVARDLNFARLLGSVTISSIPDIGRVVMSEGISKAFGDLFKDFTTGFKGIKAAKADLQAMGTALDVLNNQRISRAFDIQDAWRAENSIERGSSALATGFSKLTGLPIWNTYLKSWAGMVGQNRIMRTARNLAEGKQVSQQDLRRMAESRLTPEMMKRIAAQADNWTESNGLILPKLDQWTDPEAVEAVRLAMVRDADNAIITPGVADSPLWTQGDVGKTIFQFKRFAIAATARIALQGAQKGFAGHDLAQLNGIMVMVAAAAAANELRSLTNPRQRDFTTQEKIANAVDRSGVPGIFMEHFNFANKLSGGVISEALGAAPNRYNDRGLAGSLAGPTFGEIEDIHKFTVELLDEDGDNAAAVHRMRRLLPFQNLFYARWLFDLGEDAIAEE
jgi:hypothetical protein